MSESMAEEWARWLEQETSNIRTLEQRIEELTSNHESPSGLSYREFWTETEEIVSLFETLAPIPESERERLKDKFDRICREAKKKQQQEWKDRLSQSGQNRTIIEEKISEAASLADSGPEDIKILTRAQGLLKDALSKLKSNAPDDDGNESTGLALLREDRQACWDKWREANDTIHTRRLAVWQANYESIRPEASAALDEAEEGDSQQALEKVKKAQRRLKTLPLTREQRDEIRDILNKAWDVAIFKVNEIRDAKRRKYEEWIGRMEGQMEELTAQFRQNEENAVRLQGEVDQLKEAIQEIKSREYGDTIREHITKKREQIKELEVINRQLEGKIQSVKNRLEGQSDESPKPRFSRPRPETSRPPRPPRQTESAGRDSYATASSSAEPPVIHNPVLKPDEQEMLSQKIPATTSVPEASYPYPSEKLPEVTAEPSEEPEISAILAAPAEPEPAATLQDEASPPDTSPAPEPGDEAHAVVTEAETVEQPITAKEVERKMRIKWLGHAAFLITADDGTRIITDPFGSYAGLSYVPISETAEIVLISHQHGDHTGGTVNGGPRIIDRPGTTTVGGTEFKGIASHHDQSGGSDRGENIIFRFTLDGISVCHLGDLGHVLSEEQVAEIGEVDILMIPVGGFYTIDASEADRVCEQLEPKVIIPMHVSNEKCSFPISGVEAFLTGKTNVEQDFVSEKEFGKGELPTASKVVVLRPSH